MTEQEARELNEIEQLLRRVVSNVVVDLLVALDMIKELGAINDTAGVRAQIQACIGRLDRLTHLPLLAHKIHTGR